VLLLLLGGGGFFVYIYVHYARIIDARLSGDVFNNASLVFSAPSPVFVGQAVTPEAVAARLRRALYAEGEGASAVGVYTPRGNRLEIVPGPLSFFQGSVSPQGAAAVEFKDGRVVSISSLDQGQALPSYLLEPELITTLFDSSRSKRRLVRYQDLPPVMINAILAIEDHQFFSHHGVNPFRILAAAMADVRPGEVVQGGSTLTMQLARNFFLTPQRTIRRKLREIFIALLLEQRLTKEQIFELYANQIYLGQRGSFAIYGLGEGAKSYFNKDVSSLTLPEAALLAALIRGPNLYSPYRYPARALERRTLVLRRMLETGYITAAEAESASAATLGVISGNVEATQAPYFVDMVKDQLLQQFPERDLLSQSYRIYTTLDLDFQRAASDAVRLGMVEVDKQLDKRLRAKEASAREPMQPQVALIALDPRSGELRALVGGRNYGWSQLNHVLARRQPGSSFKPFVYAAALSSGVDGSQPVVTPATQLVDEPTLFQFGDLPYEPENYKQEYHGVVTVREALAHSLNVATVRLAEMVGYAKVRNLAVAAGVNRDLLATPAIALGAYVATPLEIVGAYTVFADSGEYVEPRFILAVNDHSGRMLWRSSRVGRQVLDPRVSYLMVSLLESVVNSGTAAGVRSRGFTLPAAGKTGTSHDGWFVGFTPSLLAVVWVGYDDDRELKLSGASAALPVWTEFMKRATTTPGYQAVPWFAMPPGIVSVPMASGAQTISADGSAPASNELFIAGTEPQPQVGGERPGGILSRMFESRKATTAPATAGDGPSPTEATVTPASTTAPPESQEEKPKKGGVLHKLISIFKGGSPNSPSQAAPPKKSDP
jgi:penicillin-binding protein 1B